MHIAYGILLYIVKITEEQPRAGALFLCRKVGVGLKVDNNRYLCNKCAENYLNAGYDIKRTGTNCDDETCEICNWYRSHEYIVIDKGRYQQQRS